MKFFGLVESSVGGTNLSRDTLYCTDTPYDECLGVPVSEVLI